MKKFILIFSALAGLYAFNATSHSQTFVVSSDTVITIGNNRYDYKEIALGSERLFRIQGFASTSEEEFQLPRRAVTIRCPQGYEPAFEIVTFGKTDPVQAHPFFLTQYTRANDSTLQERYVSLFDKRDRVNASQPFIRQEIIGTSRTSTGSSFSVPLLVWDEATKSTSFVYSVSVKITLVQKIAAARPFPQPASINPEWRDKETRRYIDTSGAWYNMTDPFLRFVVKTDALLKLDRQWFATYAPGGSVPQPAKVRAFRKGRELPLVAVGMEDGSFDPNDYFLLWTKKNYGELSNRIVPTGDDENPMYIDKYGDSAIYWITWGAADGLRAARPGAPAQTPGDTLRWYMEHAHVETDNLISSVTSNTARQQLPKWTSEDVWYEMIIKEANTKVVEFNVDNHYETYDGYGYFKLMSWYIDPNAGNFHTAKLSFNDTASINLQRFARNEQALLKGPLAYQKIVEGKNQLIAHNLASGLDNRFVNDWAEIEYPRWNIARKNFIAFPVRDGRMEGYKNVKGWRFTDSTVQILRIDSTSAVLLPIQRTFENGHYIVSGPDSIRPGSEYIFFADSSITRPPAAMLHSFANLRSTANQADYIVVTAKSLTQAATRYADFIRDKYAVTTRVVTVESIYDEFGHGFFSAEAIKNFVDYALSSWQQPRPQYFLMLGDANYNYRFSSGQYEKNYVPSYGYPASDYWYVCFDNKAIAAEAKIGRLPVSKEQEIDMYLDRHRSFLADPYTEWNKNYLFFSGGDPSQGEQELKDLQATNTAVIKDFVVPPPIAGAYHHFYKTLNPPTNFGPVTAAEYKNAIERGGLFISYIGHSGTQTWDNGIGDASQISNSVGRYPLVTDFGCSTAKFAEPDIECFAEQFTLTPSGQAIGYIGNSALGFTTVAKILPYLFYESILKDSIYQISAAHNEAKRKLVQNFGSALVHIIASQTNTFLGDPIVSLPIPTKPNYIVQASWPKVLTESPTDEMDSITVSIPYANFGRANEDSLSILVEDFSGQTALSSQSFRVLAPLYFDTLSVTLPVKGISGPRRFTVTLDQQHESDELIETDNTATLEYFVTSTFFVVLDQRPGQVGSKPERITLLNPMVIQNAPMSYKFEFDRAPSFLTPVRPEIPYGTVFSRLTDIPPMAGINSVFWKAKLDTRSGDVFQYINAQASYKWLQNDSVSLGQNALTDLGWQDSVVVLQPKTFNLHVISRGWSDGNFASVEINGQQILPNTFGFIWFFVVLDSATLTVKDIQQYHTWNDATAAQRIAEFLRNRQFGEIVVVTTADEPQREKAVFTPELKSLGSKLIDRVGFRSSYAMIGRLGAAAGTVPEDTAAQYRGRVALDTSYTRFSTRGEIVTKQIGPAGAWRSIVLNASQPNNSKILITVMGVRPSGQVDTLFEDLPAAATIPVSGINAKNHPYLKLKAVFIAGDNNVSPRLSSWSADYDYPPELAMNYQSVFVVKDSVTQGENIEFELGVVNPTQTPTDAFTIKVETVDRNNNRSPADMYTVSGLGSDAWYKETKTLSTAILPGKSTVIVTVDPENSVNEQYETNNVYTFPIFVRGDTTRPSLKVTFDGREVMDGDYVRSQPQVRIALFDNSKLAVTGISNFIVFVNDSEYTTANNPNLQIQPGAGNEKAALVFSPLLLDGENIFRINVKDGSENLADSAGQELHVYVERAVSVRDFFNYPNPFKNDTDFLFTLTGDARVDELSIKIYTIAGRLIRELKPPVSSIRIGQNRVYWNGRDENSDVLGNGVYFYKVTLTRAGVTQSLVGKMSVLR